MQSPLWYLQRLKSMSPAEILWRLQGKYLDWIDIYRITQGSVPSLDEAIPPAKRVNWQPPFRVSDLQVGDWQSDNTLPDERIWYTALIDKADKISAHQLSYFHLCDHDHGRPIDWNKDHGSNIVSPMRLAPKIDYRDFSEAGDCKLVWEPNRHQHLVVLARAYRAGGHDKYALAIKEQLVSWLQQCPYGYGMNWRSPMELSIRLINWIWAIDLTLESQIFTGSFRDQLFHSIYLHLHEVTRKYSRGSSANNHLIGEAAGVFIATSYFPDLTNASRWQAESFDILCREIDRQTSADGSNKELALEYQFFVLQFFLFCGLVGRWCGKEFPPQYWRNVEQQLLFIGRLSEGDGRPVFYGDADDGYVLNLGDAHIDPKPLLAAGAVLFNNKQCKAWASQYSESLRWLFGARGRAQFNAIAASPVSTLLSSHAFGDSGLYLLQTGHRNMSDQISVLIDCGPLGFGSLAAHGHADALSFTLKAFGQDILIDPGTYDYFTSPEWRNYFRCTRAHNTIEIDNQDQSILLGPFLWGKRATSHCLIWEPSTCGGKFVGEHDGYTRLSDPVVHRRSITLDGTAKNLIIIDEIAAKETHQAKLYFHCAPGCRVAENGLNGLILFIADQTLLFSFAPTVKVHLLYGNLQPIAGWVSRCYHGKEPITTIVAEHEGTGSCHFRTVLSLSSQSTPA